MMDSKQECTRCGKHLAHYEVYGELGETLCYDCHIYLNSPYRLLRADSLVVTCSRCGAWLDRYAAFIGEDYYWECDKCGCSSTKIRPGRPFGPKSRNWPDIVREFNELIGDIPYLDGVITEPPMKDPYGEGGEYFMPLKIIIYSEIGHDK